VKNVHRLLLITTGGTIGGRVAVGEDYNCDPATESANEIQEAADELACIVEPTLSYLRRRLGYNIDFEIFRLCDIDSSDMEPSMWVALSQLVYDRFDDFDSFIITHGTNTLGYTSAALTFALANSGKPIILTGSQLPAGFPGSDAWSNLQNAIRVAAYRDVPPELSIRGVITVFGSFILTGTRARKDSEFAYDAFQTRGSGSIGRIGRTINIDAHNLARHCNYLSATYPIATSQEDLWLDNDFDMRIVVMAEFPGMTAELVEGLVAENDVQGVILSAYGAGDAASSLRPAFEYLMYQEIPIVVSTQAPNGSSNCQVNNPGRWLHDNQMAIPSFDMTIEAQTTKLAWLLAKKERRELSYTSLRAQMLKDLRGEINVLWDLGV
jgi:L-asparaginase